MGISKIIWKDIGGWEEYYSISSDGSVRSKDKFVWNGNSYWLMRGRVLKKLNDKQGYKITILRINNKTQVLKIHRIVALAFIPNPKNKPYVNHKNGKKWDNRVENLEWVTAKENTAHAFKTGLCDFSNRKERYYKLSRDQIDSIKKSYLKDGVSQTKLATMFGVSQSVISYSIKNR